MSGRLKSATIAIILALSSMTSSQRCIRDEVRAALEEHAYRGIQGVSIPSNQSGCITGAQMEQLNNTMQ